MSRDAWWFRAFLVGIAGLGPFSLNVFSPCLPWVRGEFAVDLATVQLSASLSILAAAVATIFAGPLTDAYGRRPILVTTLVLYVVASATAALAPHIAILIVGRLVQAASSSVAFVTARALIHDVYGEEGSPRAIARISLATIAGVVMAPLAGGLVIRELGWRAVFWSTAAIGASLWLLARRVSDPARPRSATSWRTGLRGLADVLRAPAFHGFAMQSALHFAVFFAFTMTASHVMVDVLHQEATSYGLWFVLLSVAVGSGLAAADRLSRRTSPAVIAVTGSAIAFVGACLSAYFLLDSGLTPARLFVPVSISALGIGLAVPGTNAGVMAVRPAFAGTASGLMGFQQYVLAAIFAQLVVRDAANTTASLAMLSLVGCGGALGFGLLSLATVPRASAASIRDRPLSALRVSVPPRAIEVPDLSAFRLFDGVSQADRDAIGSWCVRVELTAGELLVEQGALGRELYLVAEGELEVLHRDAEHEVVVNRVRPGQDVGIMAMFEGGRRTASLRASAPSVVYRLRHEDFLQVFGDATTAPFAVMLRNQLRAHTEFLVAGNTQTIDAVRRENAEAKRRLRFGSFVAVLIGSVTLYALVLRIVLGLTSAAGHIDSTFITVGILLGCVAIYVPMMLKSGYPLSTYGLTLGDWRRGLPESLLWTAAFLAGVTALKAVAIRVVPAWEGQPLFSFYGFTRYDSLAKAIGLMAVYSLFAPVQELVARGAMQSSLHEFLSGRHARLWAIVLSTLMFSQIHLHLTPWYAVAVFFPSLFWGAMYARQRSLLGVSVSHVLIGVYVAFFLGLPMMTHS